MSVAARSLPHEQEEVHPSSGERKYPIPRNAIGRTGRKRGEKSDAAFRTIGEAAQELGLKTHVLRFWETKFSQLSPMKRRDGRRFYRPEDMKMLRTLQILLHGEGMTIKGAQRLISKQGVASVLTGDSFVSQNAGDAGKSVRDLQAAVRSAVEGGAFRSEAIERDQASQGRLNRLLDDLTDLKSRLDEVRSAS